MLSICICRNRTDIKLYVKGKLLSSELYKHIESPQTKQTNLRTLR